MEPTAIPRADAVCDGGDLDCGSGLLLIIRGALEPLAEGGVLEIKSSEISVAEDLPAWCRMVGHGLLASTPGEGRTTRYFVKKRGRDDALAADLDAARRFRWQVRVAAGGALGAKVYARNHAFEVGQPASFDTSDAAPSAIEVLLGALGADLSVGLRWRASQRGIEIRQLELSLAARADNPLVFLGVESRGHAGLEAIEGSAYVDCDAEPAVLAELWSETVARSPLAQTLARGALVAIDLRSV